MIPSPMRSLQKKGSNPIKTIARSGSSELSREHSINSDQLTDNQFQTISRLFSQQLFGSNDITGTAQYELENDLFEFLYSSLKDNHCEFKSFNELRALLKNFNSRANILGEFSQGIVDKYLISSVAQKFPKSKMMDIQGILWEDEIMRHKMVSQRTNAFKSFTNLPDTLQRATEQVDLKLKRVNNTIFEFDKYYSMSKPRQIHFQLGNLITSLNQNSIYYPIENDDGIFQLMNLDTSAYPEDDYYYDDDDDDDFDMDELHASSNEGLIHHSSSDINSNTNTNNTSRGSGTNNGNSITAPTTQPQSPSISSPFYQTSVVLEMSPNFKECTKNTNSHMRTMESQISSCLQRHHISTINS
ncbi:unnamed protein product [Ambrosiozyma monospora]|uniref:Unnamed protein product n=1 Tax=Ambrosiozyma monospora TaxID=43982 RepID=A0A9W6TAS4_AMBMO|nr:unnamed protein product [Ambrosiozyma monospora]